MSRYVEVDLSDRLEVNYDSAEVVDVTVERVTIEAAERETGLNDSYVITPYSSLSSITYEIPSSVVGAISDISTIKNDILNKLDGTEIAQLINFSYTNQFGYNPEAGTTVRDQLLTDLDALYISNGPEGDAYILDLDYKTATIGTVYDEFGNIVYEESTLLDMKNDVTAVKNSQASILDVQQTLSNWDQAYATTITNLNATYEDITVQVKEQAIAFAGNGEIIPWNSRNLVDEEGIKLASGGAISLNPTTYTWYMYVGGALGDLGDGWVLYEGSTAADAAKAAARFFEAPRAEPPQSPKRYDVWVVTDEISSVDTSRKKVLQFSGYDAAGNALDWIEIDPDRPSAGWVGSASRLIVNTDNGAITGWSAGDGSGIESSFKINADNFQIANSTNTFTPFQITTYYDETLGQTVTNSKFTGLVEFSGLGINSGSTEISGDYIKTGSIDSNQTASTGAPITSMDIDQGTIVIRDAQGRVRVKLGKL